MHIHIPGATRLVDNISVLSFCRKKENRKPEKETLALNLKSKNLFPTLLMRAYKRSIVQGYAPALIKELKRRVLTHLHTLPEVNHTQRSAKQHSIDHSLLLYNKPSPWS